MDINDMIDNILTDNYLKDIDNNNIYHDIPIPTAERNDNYIYNIDSDILFCDID